MFAVEAAPDVDAGGPASLPVLLPPEVPKLTLEGAGAALAAPGAGAGPPTMMIGSAAAPTAPFGALTNAPAAPVAPAVVVPA